ncbi:MAG: FAD-dependent oxidoreductase [Maribacter sp.]|uniref:FAD-dependent oxidoreductase n=1 Tax=Eudoraea sp. TaxID=1979955 RepID=UPI003C7330CB
MKIIIIGGVAGGASCAARLRRLDEKAEIVMVEKGPYVSYANCGLPYHVGGVIKEESHLLVANEQTFIKQFNVDARTNCEAINVLADKKEVVLKNVLTGEEYTENYDYLVLSPGAQSVRPPFPGIDLPGIFHVRTVPDARSIVEWIEKGNPFMSGMHRYSGFQTLRPKTRAVVVGGGFIGIETAENLIHRGFEVTLLQRGEQILLPIDEEMARPAEAYLRKNGLNIVLNDGATGFAKTEDGHLEVQTNSGKNYVADVVILAIGVRPDTTLAKLAGIEIGKRGGIVVDENMRTSDPNIFAVGDVVEVTDFMTKEQTLIALAGPANRQGRIAADIIAGRKASYRGTQGTSVIGFFDGTVAWTGISEKTLARLEEKDYEKVYLYPNSHAGYYPGAKPIAMKVIFRKSDGKLLGAQALGLDGVDKRISVFAAYLQMGATIYDLQEAELCYAPQFGSAKDPINFAGFVAADVLAGDMPISHWPEAKKGFMLDVREGFELAVERVDGAVNISLGELRGRLNELPKDKTIHVICRSGQRAYYATRMLAQHGFDAKNVSGGMLSLAQTHLFSSNPD